MTTPIEIALAANRALRDSGEQVIRRTKAEVFQTKPTRKSAIDLFCVTCMGGQDNPGCQALVRDCTCGPTSVLPRPLYQYRPYR